MRFVDSKSICDVTVFSTESSPKVQRTYPCETLQNLWMAFPLLSTDSAAFVAAIGDHEAQFRWASWQQSQGVLPMLKGGLCRTGLSLRPNLLAHLNHPIGVQ